MAMRQEARQPAARYNIEAHYPNKERARGAVKALEGHGIDARNILLVGAAADEAEARASEAVDTRGSDAPIARSIVSRAIVGGVIGAAMGAVAGLIVWGIGLELAQVTSSIAINLLVWGLAGVIAGTLWGGYSALGIGKEYELTYQPTDRQDLVVRVQSDKPEQIEQAEQILRDEKPVSLKSFDEHGVQNR